MDKAKLVDLDKDILGPESVAIRSSDEVYTGARDGSLVRIKNGKVTKIGAFGDACGMLIVLNINLNSGVFGTQDSSRKSQP